MKKKKLQQRLTALEKKQEISEWIGWAKEAYNFIQDITHQDDQIIIYFRERGLFGRYYDYTELWKCCSVSFQVNDWNWAKMYLAGVNRYA